MQCFSAPRSQGFTALEVALTVILIGILAAIATPSFLAWQEKSRVNAALQTVRSELTSAKYQALRQGKACRVTFNNAGATFQGVLLEIDPSTGAITALPESCLSNGTVALNRLTGLQIGDPIRLWSRTTPPASPAEVTFTYRGSSLNQLQLLVYQQNRPGTALGLEISAGLGLVRVCQYQGATLPPSVLTATNCPSIR